MIVTGIDLCLCGAFDPSLMIRAQFFHDFGRGAGTSSGAGQAGEIRATP